MPRAKSWVLFSHGYAKPHLTFNGLRYGPEIGAAIDVPLGVSDSLGCEGGVPVVSVMVRMNMGAFMTEVSVRMALIIPTQETLDASPRLAEEIHIEGWSRGRKSRSTQQWEEG
jgi:hypothetical protein